eukprot:TRINITY_DN0_c1024_g1_i4.p2 TRINITY_DN0_c1024_g1~~TRINITY_DN0_c1024_g1_i4.p2  ORF type:complete len:105 (+),score=3.91 TRINITY_DN0_c1024_g1_i4:1-315(+)
MCIRDSPTIALQSEGTVFLSPLGSLMRTLSPSSECPMTTAEVPEVLANCPLSLTLPSTLHTTVPSGIEERGSTLPILRAALRPTKTYCPVYIPSAATKYSVLCP